MANVYVIVNNGNWSNLATWNTSALPTASDDVFSNGLTVNVDVTTTVLSLRNTSATGIAAGGTFALSTPNTTVSVNSLVAGVTNLITANAISGINTLNVTNGIQGLNVANSTIINHTGAGNLTIITPSVTGAGGAFNTSNIDVINKSGLGTLTVGNSTNPTTIRGGINGTSSSANRGINSSNGDIIIVGDVIGTTSTVTFGAHSINQTAGNLTINGNVIGGNISGNAINSSSTGFLTITGNVTGGIGLAAINKTPGIITITGIVSGATFQGIVGTPTSLTIIGNVTGATASAVALGAAPITITGAVTAGASSNAVSSTSSVTVTGNVIVPALGTAAAITTTQAVTVTGSVIINGLANGVVSGTLATINGIILSNQQWQGVFAPRILIDTATTAIRYQTSSGATQVMFSGSAVTLGLPTPNNVRLGTPYGNVPQLIGTLVLPPYNAVIVGVPIDNTVGTLVMSPAAVVAELNTSTLDIAVRLRNVSTVQTMGDQAASYGI